MGLSSISDFAPETLLRQCCAAVYRDGHGASKLSLLRRLQIKGHMTERGVNQLPRSYSETLIILELNGPLQHISWENVKCGLTA